MWIEKFLTETENLNLKKVKMRITEGESKCFYTLT